jgi:hypothetical protein
MLAVPWLEAAATAWAQPPVVAMSLAAVAPLGWITAMGVGLVALVGATTLVLRRLPGARGIGATDTWGCGYAQPTVRMQYTGSSFGQTLVGLFPLILWPVRQRPDLRAIFPRAGRFESALPDTILDRLVLPFFGLAGRHLPRLRVLQQGQTQLYVLYILIVLIVLLVWGSMGVQS